jgi:hypothetical protein
MVESDLRRREMPAVDPPRATGSDISRARSLWPQLTALALVLMVGEGLLRSAARRERNREAIS